jgi:hypothetical protein
MGMEGLRGRLGGVSLLDRFEEACVWSVLLLDESGFGALELAG